MPGLKALNMKQNNIIVKSNIYRNNSLEATKSKEYQYIYIGLCIQYNTYKPMFVQDFEMG